MCQTGKSVIVRLAKPLLPKFCQKEKHKNKRKKKTKEKKIESKVALVSPDLVNLAVEVGSGRCVARR